MTKTIFDQAQATIDTFAPEPPQRLSRKGLRFEPVPWPRLRELLASFNEWVRLWNEHEANPSLPLSPAWADGAASMHSWPRSYLYFRVRSTDEWLLTKVEGWTMYTGRGLFCQRNEVDPNQIHWAGIHVPRQERYLRELTADGFTLESVRQAKRKAKYVHELVCFGIPEAQAEESWQREYAS